MSRGCAASSAAMLAGAILLTSCDCEPFRIPPSILAPNGDDIVVNENQQVSVFAKESLFYFGPGTGEGVKFYCGRSEVTEPPPFLDHCNVTKDEAGTSVWRGCEGGNWATIVYQPQKVTSGACKIDCSATDAEAFITNRCDGQYKPSNDHSVIFMSPGKCPCE